MKLRTLVRTGMILVTTVLLAAADSSATTIIAKDLAALCQEADLIFVGTVSRVESGWVDEKHESIETRVTFDVEESLAGGPGSEITLRFGGGEADGIREEIAGVPRFETGDRFVILARREHAISPIVGFNQGCLRVVDSESGPRMQTLGRRAVRLVGGDMKAADDPAVEGVSLQQFLDTIRQHLSQHEGQR